MDQASVSAREGEASVGELCRSGVLALCFVHRTEWIQVSHVWPYVALAARHARAAKHGRQASKGPASIP
eukprot:13015316-Heterocapsa_arctica.AAC.1